MRVSTDLCKSAPVEDAGSDAVADGPLDLVQVLGVLRGAERRVDPGHSAAVERARDKVWRVEAAVGIASDEEA